jgi:hypothetical protein
VRSTVFNTHATTRRHETLVSPKFLFFSHTRHHEPFLQQYHLRRSNLILIRKPSQEPCICTSLHCPPQLLPWPSSFWPLAATLNLITFCIPEIFNLATRYHFSFQPSYQKTNTPFRSPKPSASTPKSPLP